MHLASRIVGIAISVLLFIMGGCSDDDGGGSRVAVVRMLP